MEQIAHESVANVIVLAKLCNHFCLSFACELDGLHCLESERAKPPEDKDILVPMIEVVVSLTLLIATVIVNPREILGKFLDESQAWNYSLIVGNFNHFVRE